MGHSRILYASQNILSCEKVTDDNSNDNYIKINSITDNGTYYTVQLTVKNISGVVQRYLNQNGRSTHIELFKRDTNSYHGLHYRTESKGYYHLPYRGHNVHVKRFTVNFNSTSGDQNINLNVYKDDLKRFRYIICNSRWDWQYDDIYCDFYFAIYCKMGNSERSYPVINSDRLRIYFEYR